MQWDSVVGIVSNDGRTDVITLNTMEFTDNRYNGSPLTSQYNKVILQYMKNIQTFQTISREVRPLPFHTWHGEKWEVADTLGNDLQFFVHLTDALMYAEGVDTLDDLSRESRQYWNMVAMS